MKNIIDNVIKKNHTFVHIIYKNIRKKTYIIYQYISLFTENLN